MSDEERIITEGEYGSALTLYIKNGYLVVDAWTPDQQAAFFLTVDETRKLRAAVEHYAPTVEATS